MLDVDKQALGQVFSRHFSFPLLITIPPMPHTLSSGAGTGDPHEATEPWE